ncbi:hypothetical protein BATDEDRAFT_21266 [Batrachochytrium dendrobatidis JAM81]|uniref:Uncharacterized protein n=1 Tax=Batrachochytrium dendrobatidis (strain JAM81 / FGSC 10211) TaxID=684364 RepID=F4NS01_BATDJ|nr:uncharacterized protein BATDEDRAFT_21266 [Batrachochytrium dendrobatidis JAM81]EGF83789.1 hypothetical protein BATDEDRAFT_21266 [Batrachochytrium dendrobatidis JAM81]|eukprot:XP_006675240.1 hypothetical protein BATDEDRAFT_21266 [Batrachochytrium dendrobatidis JAM81]
MWISNQCKITGVHAWKDNLYAISNSDKTYWIVDLAPQTTIYEDHISASQTNLPIQSFKTAQPKSNQCSQNTHKRLRLTQDSIASPTYPIVNRLETNFKYQLKLQKGWAIFSTYNSEMQPMLPNNAKLDPLLLAALFGSDNLGILIADISGRIYSVGLGETARVSAKGLVYDLQSPIVGMLAIAFSQDQSEEFTPKHLTRANTVIIVGRNSIAIIDLDLVTLSRRVRQIFATSVTIHSAVGMHEGLVVSVDDGSLACITWKTLYLKCHKQQFDLDKSDIGNGWFKLTLDQNRNQIIALNSDGRCAEIAWNCLQTSLYESFESHIERLLRDFEPLSATQNQLTIQSQDLTRKLKGLDKPRTIFEHFRKITLDRTKESDPPIFKCLVVPVISAGRACVQVEIRVVKSIHLNHGWNVNIVFCVESEIASKYNIVLPMSSVLIPVGMFLLENPWTMVAELPATVFPLAVSVNISYTDPNVDIGEEPLYASLCLDETQLDIFSFAIHADHPPTGFISFHSGDAISSNASCYNSLSKRVEQADMQPYRL